MLRNLKGFIVLLAFFIVQCQGTKKSPPNEPEKNPIQKERSTSPTEFSSHTPSQQSSKKSSSHSHKLSKTQKSSLSKSHVEPAHVEPAHAEPAHAEPAHAEPAHAEPAHVEPAHVEPAHVEPAHVEPAHVEPAHHASCKSIPNLKNGNWNSKGPLADGAEIQGSCNHYSIGKLETNGKKTDAQPHGKCENGVFITHSTCVLSYCKLPTLENGTWKNKANRIMFNKSINGNCNQGFEGSPKASCSKVGEKGKIDVQGACTSLKKDCLTHPDDSTITWDPASYPIKSGDSLKGTCKNTADKNATANCKEDGSWNISESCL